MSRLISIWAVVCLLMASVMPSDTWARGSRASGVSVSRSTSSVAYSRASSSVSVSRPAPVSRPQVASTPAPRYVRPAVVPPVAAVTAPRYTRQATAPQAIAQSRTVSNKTINNTTIIHNDTRYHGGGGYGNGGGYGGGDRGPGLGSQILAGAAGAVAGNMMYDALTDHNRQPQVVAQPVQMMPAAPAAVAAPIQQQTQPVAQQSAPVASDVQQPAQMAAAPAPVVAPAYNDSGVGVAYAPQAPVVVPVEAATVPGSWSWVFKVMTLIGCIGALMAILIYIGNRTRRPTTREDLGVIKSTVNKLRTFAPLFIKNVNLVPGLRVTLPASVLGGEEDWSYVGDKAPGVYSVVAVGANDICAHLYLDSDRNEFIRVMLGSESGGSPSEAFFFSRIEECYDAAGSIPQFLNGKIKTYANRSWDLFWARPISDPNSPMVMGTEIVQDNNHDTSESSYSDWMYRRDTTNGGDEYLFIRRRRDDTGDYYIAYAGTDYPTKLLP